MFAVVTFGLPFHGQTGEDDDLLGGFGLFDCVGDEFFLADLSACAETEAAWAEGDNAACVEV